MQTAWIAGLALCGAALLGGAAGCGQEASDTAAGIGGQIDAGRRTQANIGLTQIKTAIAAYRGSHGRPPASLQELITDRQLNYLPPAPTGWTWEYDADTGTATAHPVH